MTERKEGWYWVRRRDENSEWECAEWTWDCWWIAGSEVEYEDSEVAIVGPRIPTPDEHWRAAPLAPTPDMLEIGVDVLDESGNLIPTYQAMLLNSPKP